MQLGFAGARKGLRPGMPGALALLLVCACAADDKVLTPDEEKDGAVRDAAAANDSGQPDGGALGDAGGGKDAGGGVDAAVPDLVSGTPATAECDLNGVWIGRQNTESEALFLSQYANNWYYLELSQEGENVTVTRHMDCGIEVRGSVTVQLEPDTTRALLSRNSQVGRKGTFAKQADGTCAFAMEKFWSVRGVSEPQYAPSPRSREVSLSDLQKENALPSDSAEAEDWDDDGSPGTTWIIISSIGNGFRHSAQRDWTRWFSATGYSVTAATDFTKDLVVRAEFSNEETVYEASTPTFATISSPKMAALHTLTLRFLGRTRQDPRAAALTKTDPFETCRAIQAALPVVAGLK